MPIQSVITDQRVPVTAALSFESTLKVLTDRYPQLLKSFEKLFKRPNQVGTLRTLKQVVCVKG